MALGARMVLAVAVAAMVLTTGVSVSGAPLAVSAEARITARLQVIAGDNATCPWQVSLLDAGGYDGGRQLCAQELGFSFGGPPTIAEVPTSTSYTNSTTELPFLVGMQSSTSTPSETTPLKAGATEERGAAAPPPEGYERVGPHGFYKLHLDRRPWHVAREACELEGAHLLVLDSSAEAHALRSFLATKVLTEQRVSRRLHAGFRLDLRTLQGERLKYESWSMGSLLAFCGLIDQDVWMLYGACSDVHAFICEYEPQASKGATETASPTPPPAPAPTEASANTKREILTGRGYAPLVGWNGTYVKNLELSYSSWQKAKVACEKDGAQLVIMESQEKADALLAFVQASGINNFFLGFKTGDPVTVLGEPLQNKSYQRWEKKNQQESCFYSSTKLLYYACGCNDSPYGTMSTICQVNVN